MNDLAEHMTPWLATGSHSCCPECKDATVCLCDGNCAGLHVRLVPSVRPVGDWSLAGNQVKFPASMEWRGHCFTCGWEGPAQMKTPEEHGRWVDDPPRGS